MSFSDENIDDENVFEQQNFDDVHDFHVKFKLEHPRRPGFASKEIMELRLKHLKEELDEVEAAYANGDMASYFDGLIDLVYVALGGAVVCGLPWQAGWDEVHIANMAKVRAIHSSESSRGSTYDVIKPKGWRPPNIQEILDETNRA